MKKDIVIKVFNNETNNILRDVKDTSIYLWKYAIKIWHDTSEFSRLIKKNNIEIIIFDNKDNYLNKEQWVIQDNDGNYWTGKWAQHPFGGKARVFLKYKGCAKKYFSKKVAKKYAEYMRLDGVFGKQGTYIISKN